MSSTSGFQEMENIHTANMMASVEKDINLFHLYYSACVGGYVARGHSIDWCVKEAAKVADLAVQHAKQMIADRRLGCLGGSQRE